MTYKLVAIAVVLTVLSLPAPRAEAQSTYGAVVGTGWMRAAPCCPGPPSP